MPSTYSPNLRLELQATGENRSTWGAKANTDFSLIESSIAGKASITLVDANYTLSTNNGATDEARNMALVATGTITAQRYVVVPSVSKLYIVKNGTTGGFPINVSTSAGASQAPIPNGATRVVWCDGSTCKTLTDATTITDTTDGTKVLAFNLSGYTTATTRTLTLPDSNVTISAFWATALDDADATAARVTLNAQTLNSRLTAISSSTPVNGGFLRWTSATACVGQEIVGTVSQSSGVPTGSLFERGTFTDGNSQTGHYRRTADGTQEIWFTRYPIVYSSTARWASSIDFGTKPFANTNYCVTAVLTAELATEAITMAAKNAGSAGLQDLRSPVTGSKTVNGCTVGAFVESGVTLSAGSTIYMDIKITGDWF